MTYTLTRPDGDLVATPEQSAIIDAARTTSDNLLINALAGAAKSTTLEYICKYVTGIPILSLAFNKRIADELGKKLPSHVECRTLNSLGHRIWATSLGRKVTLDMEKDRRLIKTAIDDLPKREQSDYWDRFSDIMSCVRIAVSSGWIPDGMFDNFWRPTDDESFRAHAEYEVFNEAMPDFVFDLLRAHMKSRITEAYAGNVDFGDQLYMPTLFGGTFPRFPLVMVDETQDLSSLNHEFVAKLVTKRIIAVGDPWQSIYGFRGAVSNGMNTMKTRFKMTEFNLSYSFRCPRSVIRKAWFRVPHMKWPEWATEGLVSHLDSWTADSVPDGAAIICRNNAPLFRTALALIRAGRGVKLIGADIGPGLIKVLSKLGPESMTAEEVNLAIDRWESEALRKARNAGSIADRAECLRVFAEQGPTLAAAIAYARHLFDSAGPIQLMSGHKSKGLEFDIVYHLDPWRIPSKYATQPEQIEQELNVKYVIETRAKKELRLVDADTLH